MITLIVCLVWIALVLVWIVVRSTVCVILVVPSIRLILPSHYFCWVCWDSVGRKSLVMHCSWSWLFRKSLLRKIVEYALIFLQTFKQFLKTGNYIVGILTASNLTRVLALLILCIFFWNLKNIEFVSFPSKSLRRIKSPKIHALAF